MGVSVLKLGSFSAKKLMARQPLFTGEEAQSCGGICHLCFLVSLFCIRFLMDFVKNTTSSLSLVSASYCRV